MSERFLKDLGQPSSHFPAKLRKGAFMWGRYPEGRQGSARDSAPEHLLHQGSEDVDLSPFVEGLQSLCPGLAGSPKGHSRIPDTAGLCYSHCSRHCGVCVCACASTQGWSGGRRGHTLIGRAHRPPWLSSLRHLLAFQILSWGMEMTAAATLSSKGAGPPELCEVISPQPLFLCPHVPPSRLLFTETETTVFTVTIFTLCPSLLGVWPDPEGQQQGPAQSPTAQARQPGLLESLPAALLLPLGQKPGQPCSPQPCSPAACTSARGACSGLPPPQVEPGRIFNKMALFTQLPCVLFLVSTLLSYLHLRAQRPDQDVRLKKIK